MNESKTSLSADDTEAVALSEERIGTPAPWVVPLVLGMVAIVLLLPLDFAVSSALRSLKLGGDIKKELNFLQQYGQASCIVIVGLIIWTLDPAQRRRLLDWGAAIVVTWVSVQVIKMFVGRPRPSVGDPLAFVGPFGAYELSSEVGLQSAWAFWAADASQLWSFPSSHTAFAMIMSVVLMTLYPRLRGVAIGAVVVVGLARIIFGAHYPSDVIVGGGIGYICTREALRQQWGVGAVERMKRWFPRTVEPQTQPVAEEADQPAPAFRFATGEERQGERSFG